MILFGGKIPKKEETLIRVSEDIEKELIETYPDSNVKAIITSLFSMILKKTMTDGSCGIREFGKFTCHKTFSSKLGADVVRFKFRISSALEKTIKTDKYILNNLPVKAKIPFTEENMKYCNNEVKLLNVKARVEASQLGDKITKEKLMSNLINELVKEDCYDND